MGSPRSPVERRLTAILSKRPVAGRVKTRLVPPLTAEQAAQLQDAMLRDVVERCAGCDAYRTLLAFAPEDERDWFEKTFGGTVELEPQEGDGLGARLAALFGRHLGEERGTDGGGTLVAVGSDQPLHTTARIVAAHAALEEGADLVLGPDGGGGYDLVGLRRPVPELFTAVEMSTPDMFGATRRLAQELGLELRELDEGLDVDTAEDLWRLRGALDGGRAGSPEDPDYPRRTARMLDQLLPASAPPPDARYEFDPYAPRRFDEEEMRARGKGFLELMAGRRSVRDFSSEPVPLDVIDDCIRVAGLAPSGANRQPWTFVVVTDRQVKERIREAAEAEERELYQHRISKEWAEALAPLGVNWQKPALSEAPVLIALFRHAFDMEQGRKRTNYYTQESVGIALGFLIAALHQAGLATLTHTPSPMGFLSEILQRPANERAYVLLPVGYPKDGCRVPRITKKALSEIRVRM